MTAEASRGNGAMLMPEALPPPLHTPAGHPNTLSFSLSDETPTGATPGAANSGPTSLPPISQDPNSGPPRFVNTDPSNNAFLAIGPKPEAPAVSMATPSSGLPTAETHPGPADTPQSGPLAPTRPNVGAPVTGTPSLGALKTKGVSSGGASTECLGWKPLTERPSHSSPVTQSKPRNGYACCVLPASPVLSH